MSSEITPKAKPVKSTGLHVGDPAPGVKKVDPILIADGVKRTFGGLTAVDVEHVEIPRNAITALIGPNGAGKTTFFNLLTGFDKPDTGDWSFEGRSLAHIPAYRVARMGLIRTFQLTKSLGLLSVMENMKLGAKDQTGENIFRGLIPSLWRKQDREIEDKALDLLKRFKLDAKKDDYAASLSGGQRKRVGLAQVLIRDPKILLMDEPFGALDAHTRVRLQNELLDIWERDRKTVMFVTHSVDEAVFLSDRVIVMTRSPGRIKEIITIDLPRPRHRAELLVNRKYQDYVVGIEQMMDHPADEAA